MHARISFILASGIFAIAATAQDCRFYLANHSGGGASGFAVSVDATAHSGICSLASATLGFAVGDGTTLHTIGIPFAWQTGVNYIVTAVLTASGPQQLSFNGRFLGSLPSAFTPAQAPFFASQLSDAAGAAEDYLLTQISIRISNGPNELTIAPNGGNAIPLPLVLLAGGAVPWPTSFSENASQTTTVTAEFRFDPVVSNPLLYDPYIDAYGQAVAASWPEKIHSDGELHATVDEERAWLKQHSPLQGFDPYGGSMIAGWADQATGYFHTAQYDGRWYLISPLGRPLFYIGLDTTSVRAFTPIANRASNFACLPPPNGPFAPAYSQNLSVFSFPIANSIRKNGAPWQELEASLLFGRLAAWAFAGSGKWTAPQPGLVVNPVLNHSDVPNVVPGGHPDVWAPNFLQQLTASLTPQILPDLNNPYVLGWSVGNEANEIISTDEIIAILDVGSGVPAKRALVDEALSAIYSGSVSALASAWNIAASTLSQVYASTPKAVPHDDVEHLRQFYEGQWYKALFTTVKTIDPHHLYLGTWTLPKDRPQDWPIEALYCDVIGFDFYNQTFLEPSLVALIQLTGKPVVVGEFSFPADYGGMRGFQGAIKDATLTDSQSGDMYAAWLRDAAANPYVVGVEWFEYLDQPLTGNGNNGQSTAIALGQNSAFGLVDVTGRPKYNLVEKVRAGNIAALQSLGLLGPR